MQVVCPYENTFSLSWVPQNPDFPSLMSRENNENCMQIRFVYQASHLSWLSLQFSPGQSGSDLCTFMTNCWRPEHLQMETGDNTWQIGRFITFFVAIRKRICESFSCCIPDKRERRLQAAVVSDELPFCQLREAADIYDSITTISDSFANNKTIHHKMFLFGQIHSTWLSHNSRILMTFPFAQLFCVFNVCLCVLTFLVTQKHTKIDRSKDSEKIVTVRRLNFWGPDFKLQP